MRMQIRNAVSTMADFVAQYHMPNYNVPAMSCGFGGPADEVSAINPQPGSPVE